MKLSYRVRLTLVTSAVSGLIFAGFLVLLVVLVGRFERTAFDSDLDRAMGHATREYIENPDAPDFKEVVDAHPGVFITVSSNQGKYSHWVGPHDSFDNAVTLRKSFSGGTLLVSRSLAQISESTARLEVVACLIWLPLTSIFAAIVWVTANSVFKPLNQMAEFAASLSDQELSSRLPKIYGAEYDSFADKLNGLLDRTQSAVHRQERFAYDAAHELRTPLTIISGLLQEEISESGHSTPERERIRTALEETERLAAISELLLASAKGRTDQLDFSCDIQSCLGQVVARWLDRFATKDVVVELDASDSRARIGERELDTVVGNLLANSFVASPPGSVVHVRGYEADDQVIIEVEDQGVGVPEELADAVFEPFVRVDPGRSRQHGGSGLGLAICNRLISEQNGSIRVSGSKFQIRLAQA